MGWSLLGEEPERPNHLCELFLDKEARMSYQVVVKMSPAFKATKLLKRLEDAQTAKVTNGPGQAHH